MKITRRALFAALAAVACRGDERELSARHGAASDAGATSSTTPVTATTGPASMASASSTATVEATGSTAPTASTAFFDAFPALARALPRTRLGRYPSAVERAPRLSSALGLDVWIKRDDLASDVYGGGKPRKLELLFGEAMRERREEIVTFGAAGSNQALAVARFGRALGLRVTLHLAPQVGGPHVRANLLAMVAAGARIEACDGVAAAEQAVARARGDAYVIPAGATTPLGDLGFVAAALELDAQIKAGVCPEPDVLFVACGTGGTAAGLAVGLRAAGRRTRVIAVRASSPGTSSRARLAAASREAVAYARAIDETFPEVAVGEEALEIDGAELGRGYGYPTAAGRAAGETAARDADLRLEPVYTEKAFAALVAQAPSLGGKTALFWTTQNALDLGPPADPAALPARLRAAATL